MTCRGGDWYTMMAKRKDTAGQGSQQGPAGKKAKVTLWLSVVTAAVSIVPLLPD